MNADPEYIRIDDKSIIKDKNKLILFSQINISFE
jgi:hypothetical protein